MRHLLIYQIYGKEQFYFEGLLSLFSLMRQTPPGAIPVHILIYTDNEDLLRRWLQTPLPGWNGSIEFIGMNQNMINGWRGDPPFVHRVKIEVLRDACQRYSGNILYCDTDTYFFRSPTELFHLIESGKKILHLDEGKLTDDTSPLFRKLNRFLEKKQKLLNQNNFQWQPTLHMWNAGVIGFNTKHQEILNAVLSSSDLLYRHYQKHVMEQLAFSYWWQVTGPVEPAFGTIYHYWEKKSFFLKIKELVSHSPAEPLAEILEKEETINPMDWQEPSKRRWRLGWFKILRRENPSSNSLPPARDQSDQLV